MQYAIDVENGAARIVHLARDRLSAGKAILRIDSSNAFNVAQRAIIRRLLEAHDRFDPDILRYFMTMYAPAAELCVYGPDGRVEYIRSDEGVRQGDAFSAYFFCLLMDVVCKDIRQLFPGIEIWCYMDDLTIACDPLIADNVAAETERIMNLLGFHANMAKSACICNDPTFSASVLPTRRMSQSFEMLGGNISANHDEYCHDQLQRIESFFDLFNKCDLHTQLKWTILRLCGFPRLIFFASVTPTDISASVLQTFATRVRHLAEDIINAPIADEYLHDVNAAGFPDYVSHAAEIFDNARTASLSRATKVTEVKLVTNSLTSASLMSQYSAHYLFYSRDTAASHMPDHVFQMALAIRMRTLPLRVSSLPKKCKCGALCRDAGEVIEHCLRCDRMSYYTHTSRHNDVRDAIASVVRSYGISVSSEPKFYSGFYDSTSERRPDLTFHTYPKITTDVTIVATGEKVGDAAREAAIKKNELHSSAVMKLGHIFMPFAMEVHGHLDSSCIDLMNALRRYVPDYRWQAFTFDFLHAVSSSLAAARAMSVLIAMSSTNAS